MRSRTTPVPYFHGHLVRMPQVLLRHQDSGRLVWFANFHNPANVFGDARRWRNEALAIEADLVHRLGRSGIPVVLTGDMNDKAEFACPFTARTGMHSADGAVTRDGRCRLPAEVGIDWIFGSAAVRFSDFRATRGPSAAGSPTTPWSPRPRPCAGSSSARAAGRGSRPPASSGTAAEPERAQRASGSPMSSR